jgi:lipopolysaccharide/colanic/teichoic acid biosynthesis glycosyltransferase
VYLTDAAAVGFYLIYEGGVVQIGAAVAVVQLMLYVERMYERFASVATILRQLFLALGVGFLTQALLAFAVSSVQLPRWTMLYGSGVVLVVFPLWRWAAGVLVGTAVPAHKILFVGASPAAARIAAAVKEQPELGLATTGYVGPAATMPELVWIGNFDNLDTLLEEQPPDRIVFARSTTTAPWRHLVELQRAGVRLEKLADLHETVCGRISLSELAPERLIFSTDLDPRPQYVLLRNLYSALIAALLLVPAAPLMAAIALLLKIRSVPVLHRERRAGRKGKEILLYRFNPVTKWKWTRNLPLLLNLARGDIAWIGPAAERPEFADKLRERIPLYNHRLRITPGLTGWAELHVDAGMPDTLAALEYDLYYIKHLSPLMDAYVALLSIRRSL